MCRSFPNIYVIQNLSDVQVVCNTIVQCAHQGRNIIGSLLAQGNPVFTACTNKVSQNCNQILKKCVSLTP